MLLTWCFQQAVSTLSSWLLPRNAARAAIPGSWADSCSSFAVTWSHDLTAWYVGSLTSGWNILEALEGVAWGRQVGKANL